MTKRITPQSEVMPYAKRAKTSMRRNIIGKSDKLSILAHDGTPCAVKAACTVWGGGKLGDYIKELPIAIGSLLRYSGP